VGAFDWTGKIVITHYAVDYQSLFAVHDLGTNVWQVKYRPYYWSTDKYASTPVVQVGYYGAFIKVRVFDVVFSKTDGSFYFKIQAKTDNDDCVPADAINFMVIQTLLPVNQECVLPTPGVLDSKTQTPFPSTPTPSYKKTSN